METTDKPKRARPLSPKQTVAAEQLGRGWKVQDVAAEAGVSTKAISRWQQRGDFRRLIELSRRRVLEENPTAVGVLTSALSATKRDGTPDYNTRVTAARALLGRQPEGETVEEKVRETKIFLAEDSK